MDIWDIVICKVYFVEMSWFKLRPVLLFQQMWNDFLFLPLTTNLERYWYLLKKEELSLWNLNKDSLIIVPKFWLINKEYIYKKIDKLKDNAYKNVSVMVCSKLGCIN